MPSLKRQSLVQFLENPVFEQCFQDPECKARVRAVISWIRARPHTSNQALLTQHSQNLVQLKKDIYRAAAVHQGDLRLFQTIRSSLEAWPLVLLLNIAFDESVGTAVSVLSPFLNQWEVETSDDENSTLSLFDHLLKDFTEMIIDAPVLNSERWLDLGLVLSSLDIAFGSNVRALMRLRLCLVHRVDRLQKMATTLCSSYASGDASKVERILLELIMLVDSAPKRLLESVRFLTPSIFTLCHHIWSQGPIRLGSSIFLKTLALLRAWSSFVADTPKERKQLTCLLCETNADAQNTLTSLHTQMKPTLDFAARVNKFFLTSGDSASTLCASSEHDNRGILDKLQVSELDMDWKQQGVTSTLRILEVITNSEHIRSWEKDHRRDCLIKIAYQILEIADACMFGFCRAETTVNDNVLLGDHPHLLYLTKWCIRLLIDHQDVFDSTRIPPLVQSLAMPRIQRSFDQALRDLDRLDTLALAYTDGEMDAKLTQIAAAIKYLSSMSGLVVTEHTILAFCGFLIDRLMICRSSSKFGSQDDLEPICHQCHSSLNYLFTGKVRYEYETLINQEVGTSSKTYFTSNIQALLMCTSGHLQLILESLLFFEEEDNHAFGLRKFLDVLGLQIPVSVYEWRHVWMGDSLWTLYASTGKALFWRKRLLKWYCCYLWLHNNRDGQLSDSLIETIISDSTLEVLELQTQRLKHDSFTKNCDNLATLLSLESLFLVLAPLCRKAKKLDLLEEKCSDQGPPAQALVFEKNKLDRHLSVLTPLFLFISVSGTCAQISSLNRLLRVLDLTDLRRSLSSAVEMDAHALTSTIPALVLRDLCLRHHRRVLRVFTSKIRLGDDEEKLTAEDSTMWDSLSLLLDYLDGASIVALGHRMWDDLRWCQSLSKGCTLFLARLSHRMCEELHKERMSSVTSNNGSTDESDFDISLPCLGLRPEIERGLRHNEDHTDDMMIWKDWRGLADMIILKMGGMLSGNRGCPQIAQPCLCSLFNCLYVHTTQVRGYLSRLHQVWQYIQPLFTNYSLRTTDISICLEGMEFSMLKFAGQFFEARFHQDVEPVITRYMLEVALDEELEMDQHQIQCVMRMLQLVTTQSLIMTTSSARTHITCLCSILIATRRKLPAQLQQAATKHLIQLHKYHQKACDYVFSVLTNLSDPERREQVGAQSQLVRLISLYDPMKSRGPNIEALQRQILSRNESMRQIPSL